jgi:hypothetical protein
MDQYTLSRCMFLSMPLSHFSMATMNASGPALPSMYSDAACMLSPYALLSTALAMWTPLT